MANRIRWWIPGLALLLSCVALHSATVNRAILTGRVVDIDGRPLGHATVLVYHAGVKTGYSTFCPSC